jgi:hypothetical protein
LRDFTTAVRWNKPFTAKDATGNAEVAKALGRAEHKKLRVEDRIRKRFALP